jgi:phage regulator Rha-like protein
MSDLIPIERIESKILVIRGQKVLLDRDLAGLYEVPTSQLKRAVKRNITRFPEGFMFILSQKEFEDWRCQFGTSNDKMGLRYHPMAFSEQGVAMLSSVLNSERAIQVNIAIIKAFVQMRELLLDNAKTAAKLRDIEDRMDTQEMNTIIIMDKLRTLTKPPQKTVKKIGFNTKK